MRCLYCGKELWIFRDLLDRDFCSAAHRRKYHSRVRLALSQLPQQESPPGRLSGFNVDRLLPAFPPVNARTGGSFRWDSGRFLPGMDGIRVSAVAGHGFLAAMREARPCGRREDDRCAWMHPELRMPRIAARGPRAGVPGPAPLRRAVASPASASAAPIRLPVLEPAWREPERRPCIGLPGLSGGSLALLLVARAPRPARQISQPKPRLGVPAFGWASHSAAPRLSARVDGVAAPPPGSSALWPVIGPSQPEAARARSCAGSLPPASAKPILPFMMRRHAGAEPAPASTPAAIAGASAPAVRTAAILRPELSSQPAALQPTIAASGLAGLADSTLAAGFVEPVRIAMLRAKSAAVRNGAAPIGHTRQLALPRLAAGVVLGRLPAPEAPRNEKLRSAKGAGMRPLEPLVASAPLALPGADLQVTGLAPAMAAAERIEAKAPPAAARKSCAGPRIPTTPVCLPRVEQDPISLQFVPAGRKRVPGAEMFQAVAERGSGPAVYGPLTGAAAALHTPVDTPVVQELAPACFADVAPPALSTAPKMLGSDPSLAAGAPSLLIPAAMGGGERRAEFCMAPPDLSALAPREPAHGVDGGREEWTAAEGCVGLPEIALKTVPPKFYDALVKDWRPHGVISERIRELSLHGTVKLPIFPTRREMGELLRSTAPVYWKGLAAGIVLASVLSLGGPAAKGVRSLGQGQAWIRQGIAERAAQEFADNFHYGMTSWNGGKDWLYNAQGGYIRPSSLALFGPSMQLSDYRMEFLAQIERRSVGWVVRAKDERNYYAMKFTVTEPGPRPMVAVERYPVINGKHGPRVQVPVPLIMQNDVPYRVQLDVRGNEFRASIEGQVVDSWTDDQLTTGGVGFFSDAGERARVYWMRVAHNDDLLGRVCAVLAKA